MYTNGDQCTELLNYFGPQHPIALPIWEIPIPVLPGATVAMVLPKCAPTTPCSTPKDFDTFINSWLDPGNANPTPLLISIHESQLKDNATQWFVPWVRNMDDAGKIKFVTVQCVVDMYAAGEKLACADAPIKKMVKRADPNTCGIGSKGYATSAPKAGATGKYPYCNYDCPSDSYGENCYVQEGFPGVNPPKFTTYFPCTGSLGSVPIRDKNTGAYPWVGNPLGNSTIGTSCNTFPKVTAPTPKYDQCTNEKPYTAWSSGPQNIVQYCVQYGGDSGTPPNVPGVYRCLPEGEAFCKTNGPAIQTIPLYWSLHMPDPDL